MDAVIDRARAAGVALMVNISDKVSTFDVTYRLAIDHADIWATVGTHPHEAKENPDLKASANFQQLQRDLSDVENKLSAARRFFNNAVSELNAAIESFPAVLFSRSLGFTHKEFFDVGDADRKTLDAPPQVKF
jgi:Tat protein secretion system quality control protein TatD with DNase activity